MLPRRLTSNYHLLFRYSYRRFYATPTDLSGPRINANEALDQLIAKSSVKHVSSLKTLIEQYNDRAGRVLQTQLPYEPAPKASRRVKVADHEKSGRGLVLVAHCVRSGADLDMVVCTGFAIGEEVSTSQTTIVTCAHTLEKIRRSRLLGTTKADAYSVIISHADNSNDIVVSPVSEVLSSLPRSDLLLLSVDGVKIPTLPVSPYPAQAGSRVHVHHVSHQRPLTGGDWVPWIAEWRSWNSGVIMGYRDFTGRETTPGTYDALSHMLFRPLPTEGSSGGPVVDENGAVVGVALGSRMDNRIEGLRGWGVPSETIFEMFSLPGLKIQ